jgi:hypothetical protein
MKVSEEEIARIVDECVDKILREGQSVSVLIDRYPDFKEFLDGPLQAALWMRNQQAEFHSPQKFVQRSKARLLSQLPRRSTPRISPNQNRGWIGGLWLRTAAIGIFLLLLTSITGVVYAAKLALPGDVLYPTKLVIEDFQTNLTRDPYGQAWYGVQKMDNRLSELEALVSQSDYTDVEQAVTAYDAAVETSIAQIQNVNLAEDQKILLAQKLQEKLGDHLAHLEEVRVKLPQQAKNGIERAIEVSSHGLTVAQNVVQGIHGKATPTPSNSPVAAKKATSTPTPTPTPTATPKNNQRTKEVEPSPTDRGKKDPNKTPGAPDKTPPGLENKPTERPKPDHSDTGAPPKPEKTPKK